ncbi:hypothetical protein D9M68_693490 [compost metagenome]
MFVGGHHTVVDARDVLQRGFDGRTAELAVADAEQRVGQQVGAVVGLGRGHGHSELLLELARKRAQERRAPFVAWLGDEGLGHQRAFGGLLGAIDEEGEGQGPRAHLRHVPLNVPAPDGDGGVFGSDGVAEHHVGPRRARRRELLAQVLHAQGKARHVHGLEVLLGQRGLHVFEAGLAVPRGVGEHRHLGPAAAHQIVHHKGGLDGVARRGAEDVALGCRIGGRQWRARRARDDQGALGLLEHLQRFHGHAGVAVPDGGHHAFGGQFAGRLEAGVWVASVVFDHQAQRSAEIATHGIDLLDRELHALQHGLAEV